MEAPDRRLAHRPGQQRTHRGSQQLDQEGQACCLRVHLLPELPDPLTALRREAQLGSAPDDQTPLKSEESVAQGLLDDAELLGHVSHGPLLVDDQGCRVTTELLRISPWPAGRRRLDFGHYWHDYLLFEVSGQWGDGQN